MIDEIKQNAIWQKLSVNPKFESEFEKCIRNCLYNVSGADLVFDISDNKLIVYYNSSIKNRDLDCQYKIFDKTEFYLDEENNLVVNKLDGRLESNYGYDFVNTDGGVAITNYMCQVYDNDGIELDYQGYSDKYHLTNEEFKVFKDGLKSVIEGAYNPNLASYANVTNVYPRSSIIGRDANFVRQIRSKENLGIVEVSKCSLTPDARIKNRKEEYYFNTFFTGVSKRSPELIHIINGYPFAVIDNNNKMNIDHDYIRLGLTDKNYREVARDRFLKELIESKNSLEYDDELLPKYDLMINKLESGINEEKSLH